MGKVGRRCTRREGMRCERGIADDTRTLSGTYRHK